MYINTNVSALFAENSLNNTENTLGNLQKEMSTGYKINAPSDNPSGLAISTLMSGELGAINSATSNATEASDLLNTANGGMQTDIQIVQQIQQLAVQASNSTNNSQDTGDIQNQIQQLLVSMDNVSKTLNYNNQFVLGQGPTTSAPTASNEVLSLASGASAAITNITGTGFASTTITPATVTAKFTAATGTGSGSLALNFTYEDTTFTTTVNLGSTTAGTGTTTVTFTSNSATLGTVSMNISLNEADLTAGSTATATVSVAAPISSIQIGADSGGIASGAYTVQAYASAGTDYLTVLDSSSGTTVATGSVANIASLAGTVSLQLVSGYNSSGSTSFIINVDQTALDAATAATPATASFTVGAGAQYTFQTGPNQGAGNTLKTSFGSFTSATLGLNNLDISTSTGAQYAISQARSALSLLTNAQSGVGSQIDQINYTLTNLQTESTNLQSSQSSIMDANMATVTSQFAQTQILAQTGIQALSTAQQLPALVEKLLS